MPSKGEADEVYFACSLYKSLQAASIHLIHRKRSPFPLRGRLRYTLVMDTMPFICARCAITERR